MMPPGGMPQQPQQPQSPQPGGAAGPTAAGSMNATARPKNRFIDRVLMNNRAKLQQDATGQLAAEQNAAGVGTGAPNPMANQGVQGAPGQQMDPRVLSAIFGAGGGR